MLGTGFLEVVSRYRSIVPYLLSSVRFFRGFVVYLNIV